MKPTSPIGFVVPLVLPLDSYVAARLLTDGHLLDLLGRDADGPIKRDARAG